MSYVIAEVAVPASDDIEPSWVAIQTDALARTVLQETYGNDDFADSIRTTTINYAHQDDGLKVRLVAVEGIDADALPRGRYGLPAVSLDRAEAGPEGRLIARAGFWAPVHDNLTTTTFGIDVIAERRREGIATALHRELERISALEHRTVVQGWETTPVPGPDDPVVVPKSGVSRIARNASAEFCLALGYELEQAERHSQLDLPVPAGLLDRLWDESAGAAHGYRIEAMTEPVPDELVQPLCTLLQHFSTQEPSAGLETEETNWTPERYREVDARRLKTGMVALLAIAVHEASGEVVAMSEIEMPTDDHTDVAFQEITIVDARHRGHRLGMLTKVANLRQLAAEHPERRRIHTWNAHENSHMLAINDALGFTERTAEGAWQKRLSPSSAGPA